MVGRRRTPLGVDLLRAEQRFKAWRRSRKAGTRIPERLWTLAVQLAAVYGVARTASMLGLDYYGLKKRAERSGPPSVEADPAFIELSAVPLAPSRECVIELEDTVGSRMRLSLKGYDASDLAALTRDLWDPQ